MTTIAILGATSQIARDFIARSIPTGKDFFLFSRRPVTVSDWLAKSALPAQSLGYEKFSSHEYDAVINFIGLGDPAKLLTAKSSILEVTSEFDSLALAYLKHRPSTRYIFLSSGAAYGTTFREPASLSTVAQIPVNAISDQDYYSIAKIHAETRHRGLAPLPIVDVRVFSYFSRAFDLSARYFLTDALRAIQTRTELETSPNSMIRDYLTPQDFYLLIDAILQAQPTNDVFDAYTRAPIEKFELLSALEREFGLKYRVVGAPAVVTATGEKPAYFSINRRAASLGYLPTFTSLEGILQEARTILQNASIS